MNQKQLERYNEKLKEKTMRMEIDKKYTETERINNKYEEKYSNLHTFDNNPQFQRMLKNVSNQLILFFIGGIIYFLFNNYIYFFASNKKQGLGIVGMCISIIAMTFCIILFIALNMGLLNDKMYVKAYVSDKINFTNFGPCKIKNELENMGIDSDLIEIEFFPIYLSIVLQLPLLPCQFRFPV